MRCTNQDEWLEAQRAPRAGSSPSPVSPGVTPNEWPVPDDKLKRKLIVPSQGRLYYIRYALKMGWTLDQIHALCKIDHFFLDQIAQLVEFEDVLCSYSALEAVPAEVLLQAKQHSRRQLGNELATLLPQRMAEAWLATLGLDPKLAMPELRDRDLHRLGDSLMRWTPTPSGTEGWRKAEVTAGGVDTRELDSRQFASRRQRGLHFIGEVVDVTGWLGGYNFQWAWASAAACAQGLEKSVNSQ